MARVAPLTSILPKDDSIQVRAKAALMSKVCGVWPLAMEEENMAARTAIWRKEILMVFR
jgi:hypothetical protein